MKSRWIFAGLVSAAGSLVVSGAALAQGATVQPAVAAPPSVVIKTPTDPVAKAAFDMLDKHCARCHQEGKLGQKLKPAGRFGNTLILDELAVNANMVMPGNPDASLLFNIIAEEKMPYDVFQDIGATTPPTPTAEELEALRAWITSLGKSATASCDTRKFVKNTDVVAAISADLERQRDHRVKGMRYLTLTNLYNACTDEKQMEGYRQGAVKMLNSLSHKTDVVRLETIDPEKTIVRFNIDDLGWTEQDWNTILSAYPYGSKPPGQLFTFLQTATGTPLPYVRADWFAYTASSPPLYNVLLRLPKTAQELEKKLGLDTLENIRKLQVQRAGFQRSGVSANNRLIERHTIASGYFWTSYDFAGNRDRQSLFKFPLGPHGEAGFDHDGGETLFSLPNGFSGYYLSTAKGEELDRGPTAIVRDPSRRDLAVTNGISCFGCHDQGIRKAQDDVRKQALADRSFSKQVRDTVEAIYPPVEVMNKILDEDQARFRSAMVRAGIDPGLKVNGIEIINALAQKYDDLMDLRRTAAEFGMRPEEFKDAAANAGPKALGIARRVDQGLLPRDTLEGEFPSIFASINDEEVLAGVGANVGKLASLTHDGRLGLTTASATIGGTPAVGSPGGSTVGGGQKGFDLSLTSDKSVYNQGDTVVLTVTTRKACNLTLINVDQAGAATIIFPNRFQQDNKIAADRSFTFGDSSAFKFRLADKGVETVVAECNASRVASRGLEANYRANGFTDLGDFSKRITRQIVADGQAKRAATRKIVVEAGSNAEVVKPSTGIPGAVSSVAPSNPDTLARTAIKMTVR